MKNGIIKLSLAVSFLYVSVAAADPAAGQSRQGEKTAFQTSGQWKPVTDVRSDVAIVYGTLDRPGMTFEERVESWRSRGYITHFMTGIAWGDYQEYFTGKWDGKEHFDEGQVRRDGEIIWHGHQVPYIVPTDNFLEYIKQAHIKRVIDSGIDAVYLEEPEFWARAGYSEAFKKEWKKFYGTEWQPQHESPENTYLSNKLKYHLYYNALNDVFTFAKDYGKSKGMDVRCYIPTHSLVNYSQWQIVSPEASLASLPCVDGYIAQVWTGTSREPNWFDGVEKERVFETAFLEYGSMESMTAPTGRKMFFLTDPIEDWPRDWVDYKKNYQATFVAQLLYPNIADYEVMPWPDRIYEGLYRTSPDSEDRERIPRHYSTQMQVMVNTLNDMPLSGNKVSGTHGISVLMANSLMFQRYPTHDGYEDPQLANFYGLALPFLKRGVPVGISHYENLGYEEAINECRVLLMTYSNMKPPHPEGHMHIAEWVKKGGVLVYAGRDSDPFQSVREWWNSGGNDYGCASAHLFGSLGIDASPAEGEYRCGKGKVYVIRRDPKEFVLKSGSDGVLVETVKSIYEDFVGDALIFKNHFLLERGPYDLIAVLDENSDKSAYEAEGLFIDLFDPLLPVYTSKRVGPGEQAFLYNVSKVTDRNYPQILAGAARAYDESRGAGSYSFTVKSPKDTDNVMRVLLPSQPVECSVTRHNGGKADNFSWDWDGMSKTCLLKFGNDPDGAAVSIRW